MYGAIIGDIVGSPYEFLKEFKTKDFDLFNESVRYTDDTVTTVAVTDALINIQKNASDDDIKNEVINKLRIWGNKYPFAKYGQKFILWLGSKNPKPYASFGNGSAMRVSSVGWLFNTPEQTNHVAKLTAEITHNQEEGIKGRKLLHL